MVKNILFILVGIVSIGLSISCFNADTGHYVDRSYYGGDAYTGIQHAAAETGQNVQDLAKLTAKGFGSILLVSGLALIVVGIPSSKGKEKEILETAPKPAESTETENA